MAFSEQDKTYVRKYLGYGAVFIQAEPRLDNALQATQSQADGGARPDSNNENAIKILIYGGAAQSGPLVTPGPTAQNIPFAIPSTLGLLAIEQQLQLMWAFPFAAGKQDEASIDTYRGMLQLRSEGRRLCHALAKLLGMKGVRADVFSPGTPVLDDDPFSYSDLEHWMKPY